MSVRDVCLKSRKKESRNSTNYEKMSVIQLKKMI
jgi:hypothetical protein